MKLDSTKHKMCASRDGCVAVLADPQDSCLQWFVTLHGEDRYTWHDDGYELKGDWLPVELPKFPELPPKPLLCLSLCTGDYIPEWRVIRRDGKYVNPEAVFLDDLHLLTVIPHPDNDPEAVRLIEEAQK